MSFADLLKPRREVLSDAGVEGIIDIENLKDRKKKKLEARPELFLDLTYPTADVKRVIEQLNQRFSGRDDTPGLFLFEGLKGCGKSHLLLLVYHLFNSPGPTHDWLKRHNLQCSLPTDGITVINKFTDLPLTSIWDFVYEKVTSKRPQQGVVQPSHEQIKEILGDRRLILILDELEQGIRVISDPAVKDQNIAFLQMLSEWSNRSDQVTVFASIYSDLEEPGATLKRVPCCRVNFGQSHDKARVVLHRLFENYLDFDPNTAASVVDSYINVWKKQCSFDVGDYRSEFLTTYPFLPELLDLLLKRIPARGGFQGMRGALGFLGNMVRLSHKDADIVTAAHANLSDREVTTRLGDIDTSGYLVSRGASNLDDIIRLKKFSFAPEIAASVLLSTLAGSGRTAGATRNEIIKHVLAPGMDINEFEHTLMAFPKYASNFHYRRDEDRYYFDLLENSDAKVEYQSLRVDDEEAKDLLRELWKNDIFRESNCVFCSDVDETKNLLEAALDKGRLRYVMAMRRLTADERHSLYHGLSIRNQVILLEPKDGKFDLHRNQDIMKWAKRQKAGRLLADATPDANRRNEYERLIREDKRNCIETIKRAGLVYVRWEKYGNTAAEDMTEEEAMPVSGGKDDLLQYLQHQVYPVHLFEEHLRPRISEAKGHTIHDIDQEYRNTLTFPVPTTRRSVSEAIRNLGREGDVGIRHPRGNFCGEYVDLNETELLNGILDEPFQTSVQAAPVIQPQQPPAGQPVALGTGATQSLAGAGTGVVAPPATQDTRILPQNGTTALRQEVASKLQQYNDATTAKVQFTIFLNQSTGDLSSMPAGLRGNLSGAGYLTAEINITKEGSFTKVQIERFIDSLPVIQNADYSARLTVRLPQSAD